MAKTHMTISKELLDKAVSERNARSGGKGAGGSPPKPPVPTQPPPSTKPTKAPSPMKITCTSEKGVMEADVREKLVDDLVEFLKSVELEKFIWNLKLIDTENVGREQEHACTAIGSVKDGKFNVGFVLFKRVDSNGNANDDPMESSCLDMMNIGKVIKQAIEEEKIEQEKRKQEPDFGGM